MPVGAGLRLVATAVLAAACLVGTALSAPAGPSSVRVGSSQLQSGCGLLRSTNVPVDWYAPEGKPAALVYLQHGFLGNKRQMRDAALGFAHAGYLVVVPSLSSVSITCGINSDGFVRSLAETFADGSLEESLRDALGDDGPTWPSHVVLAGHSVGAAVVTLMSSVDALRPHVSLLVHLDGVESIRGFLHTGLRADASRQGPPLPILQLTAPPSSLNASNSGPRVVDSFRAGGSFRADTDGALVVTATHCDPLGDFPINVCGTTPENQRAFFDLAVAGANDVLAQPGPTFDATLDRLDGRVERLPRLTAV